MEKEKTKNSYLLYQSIIDERGLSSYRVCMEAKIPQSCPSRWKMHGIVPKYERMQRIADVLTTPERPVTAADFYRADQEGGTE